MTGSMNSFYNNTYVDKTMSLYMGNTDEHTTQEIFTNPVMKATAIKLRRKPEHFATSPTHS
jgi:hypothetical protein